MFPAPQDLVAWWPGDDDANDLAHDNHGILLNGSSFAPGKVAAAFLLDGVDDAVRISEAGTDLDGFPALTVDAWIYPTTVADTRSIVT